MKSDIKIAGMENSQKNIIVESLHESVMLWKF